MFIYIMMFIILIFLSLAQKKRFVYSYQRAAISGKTFFAICVGIILTLIMGLRGMNVGCDLPIYLNRFNNSLSMYEQGRSNVEWGYNYINYLFHDILNFDFQVMIFAISCLCIVSVTILIHRYSENILISVIVYLSLGNFALNMSGLRQTIAISLVLIAVIAAEKRKLCVYIVLIGLAYIVHNSAIIFLPMYFLWGIRINRKQGIVLLIISLAAFLYRRMLNPLILLLTPEKYAGLDLDATYNINYLVILTPVVLCVFSILFLNIDDDGKLSLSDSFFLICSCISILMTILSLNNNQLGRLSYYFNLGYAIVMGSSVKKYKTNNMKSAKIIEMLVCVLFIAYFFISESGGTMHIDNYSFFWEN